MLHYNDVIMSEMASQITSPTIAYLIVYSGADQIKHQSSMLLAFMRVIHRWPANSHHKGSVTRKIFPFDDVIMDLYDFFSLGVLPRWSHADHHVVMIPYIEGLVQNCSNSSAQAAELLQFCTKPSIYFIYKKTQRNVSLTHWGRVKMDAVSQTTLSNAFSWMKMLEFRLRFHWSLFLRVQLTIFQHWFR